MLRDWNIKKNVNCQHSLKPPDTEIISKVPSGFSILIRNIISYFYLYLSNSFLKSIFILPKNL